MTRTPKFKSDAFKAIHSNAAGMLRASATDQTTMRRFDESGLTAPRQERRRRLWNHNPGLHS